MEHELLVSLVLGKIKKPASGTYEYLNSLSDTALSELIELGPTNEKMIARSMHDLNTDYIMKVVKDRVKPDTGFFVELRRILDGIIVEHPWMLIGTLAKVPYKTSYAEFIEILKTDGLFYTSQPVVGVEWGKPCLKISMETYLSKFRNIYRISQDVFCNDIVATSYDIDSLVHDYKINCTSMEEFLEVVNVKK